MLKKLLFTVSIAFLIFVSSLNAQHTIARDWNELLLTAIRNDLARPTVHARNLYHTSIVMYDVWAVHQDDATSFFLGQDLHGFNVPFDGFTSTFTKEESIEIAMSYASYRLLRYRFGPSPGAFLTITLMNAKMAELGLDPNFTDTDYSTGNPAALGNYIAGRMIAYGSQDGSNEQLGFQNTSYTPVNPPLVVKDPGNPGIIDFNRWQPLALDIFIDQSGNPIPGNIPEFLSPEWGQVQGFALKDADKTTYNRAGFDYQVYHDPGPPPNIDVNTGGVESNLYKWNFQLVSIWGSHLDPSDGAMVDISPSAQGNFDIRQLPTEFEDFSTFYNLTAGGDASMGRSMNPSTGQAYAANVVPRGDYTRVLAEFWADGPDSETPPGHWFTILNYVNDQPQLEKRFAGVGDVKDDLEWDVKSYLTLGGAMHDCAITAWGLKGWYDYLRPISAIRGLAGLGQSTDNTRANYAVGGIALIPDYIEIVEVGDALAGASNEHVGKIKLYTWKGPDYINNPVTDVAGVDWILAENWNPYQRPSFVTPPFAGYVSGHSTYSRAAAEVLSFMTGDEYFPGGMGEFVAQKDNFLVFEKGPSVEVKLQWATYRDASDQTSLSRIWGGIHPPADDLPGRLIGEQIGVDAFFFAADLFGEDLTSSTQDILTDANLIKLFPNPLSQNISAIQLELDEVLAQSMVRVFNINGQEVYRRQTGNNKQLSIPVVQWSAGIYTVNITNAGANISKKIVVQ